MARSRWVGCLIWLNLLPVLAGCQGAFGPSRLPEDPLFVGHDPVESRAKFSPPTTLTHAEPAIPLNRVVAKNAAAHGEHYLHAPRTVPGILTSRSTPPERDIEWDDE